jgi:putative transposase
MKWLIAEKADNLLNITVACEALGMSKSAFYEAKSKAPSPREAANDNLDAKVESIFTENKGRCGSPRIHAALKQEGLAVGRNRVIKSMKRQGLQVKQKRFKVRTTDSKHDDKVAPNLLEQNFKAKAPNEKWLVDVTYLSVPTGFVYLAAVLDAYSRALVGWALSEQNDALLTTTALKQAASRRQPAKGLVHHSDRGSTYTAESYRNALKAHGMQSSMSATGNCYDNAMMESWFATLKRELSENYPSIEAARLQLFEYIEEYYNRNRLHSSLDYKSPFDYECELKKAA